MNFCCCHSLHQGLAFEFVYGPTTAPVETHRRMEDVIRDREKEAAKSCIFEQPFINLSQLQRQFPNFVHDVSQFTEEQLRLRHG